MTKYIMSIAISVIGLVSGYGAIACSVPRNYVPEDLKEAEVVFKGRVIKVEYVNTPRDFRYKADKKVTILTYKVEKNFKGKKKKYQKRIMHGVITTRYKLSPEDWKKIPKINNVYIMGAKRKTYNFYEDALEFIDYGYCSGSLVFESTFLTDKRVEYAFREELGLNKKRIKNLENSILKRLSELLESKNSDDVFFAIRALGKTKIPGAVDPLIKQLHNKDQLLKLEAASSLRHMGQQTALNKLIDILRSSNNPTTISKTIYALGGIKSKEAISDIIMQLKSGDSSVRFEAVRALGDLEAYSAVSKLIESLEDKDQLVREYSALALGKLNAKQALPDLKRTLSKAKTSAEKNTISEVIRRIQQ